MARDRTEKLWIGGAAGLALLVVLVGWFFLVSPQRDETADVENQVLNAQLQNDTLQARINKLGGEKKAIAKYRSELAKAHQALPATNDMSAFLRSVQKMATASGATVTSLTVSPATTPSGMATAPAAAPSTTTGDTASPAVPGAPAAAPSIQAIPITASVSGTDAALNRFLVQLQSVQPRAVLVTNISSTGQKGSGVIGLQLTMQAFVAPQSAATTSPPSASPSPGATGTGG